jgi:putative hemolysin
MTLILVEFAALVFLLVCSAFFSSAETALFSLDPIQVHRIKRSHPRSGGHVERMLLSPSHLLSTILIGNTLVNITAAGLGYVIAIEFSESYGKLVSLFAMTVLLLVFGEVAPKRFAVSRAERLASLYAPLLTVLMKIMFPLRFVMERISSFTTRHTDPSSKALTEDEFLTVVEVGEEEGVLDQEERTMVDGIIGLEETQASDVMTPRVDLVGIDLKDSIDENTAVARRVTFRYLPVYRESLDNAEGFLDVPRFLLTPGQDLEAAFVPPYFVPETAPLDALLARFQKDHARVAFVVDEYGGTAGLITRGDILEEIVADVEDEYGEKELEIQEAGHNRWLVDGGTSLEDISDELDIELDAEGADRIAGWTLAHAERILRAGEVVEAQGCRVTVQRVRKNRITLVLLEELPGNTGRDEGP